MEQNSSKSAAKKEQPFDDVLNVLSGFKNQITGLIKQVKSLEKSCNKRMKALEKEAKKNNINVLSDSISNESSAASLPRNTELTN